MAKQEKRQSSALIVGKSGPSGTGRKQGAFAAEVRAALRAPAVGEKPVKQPAEKAVPFDARLGRPLTLPQVAQLIGYSPWSVRQTLIRKGLPYARFGANGRLIFYQNQVVRWIEKQQGGNAQL